MQSHLSAISASGDKDCSPLPGMGEGGPLCKGNSCLMGMGGQRALPVSTFSQLPLAQNNPYAKVAHVEGCIL